MNERRTNPQLRKLILVGSLMATRLERGEPQPGAAPDKTVVDWGRQLAAAWEHELAAFRSTVMVRGEPAHIETARAIWPSAQLRDLAADLGVLIEPVQGTIGRCDDCGLVDHHLVKGLFPKCATKTGGDHAPVRDL